MLEAVPVPKKRKARKQSQHSESDRALIKTMKRLGMATQGLDGKAAGELLKAAALQMAYVKLQEVASLLQSVGITHAPLPNLVYNNTIQNPPSNGISFRRLTPEEADARATATQQRYAGPTCKICGLRAAGKNSRGMDLCIVHLRADGSTFTAEDKIKQFLQRGQASQVEQEVIEVPRETIDAALATQDGQPTE